ncbi:MAG TPA: DUF2339 domain-containing protein [candidate division Zixibacteria bacterium]|nr:DUF2339 domain-containing protein [candidate division Zixibacteria bacterium]
MPEHNNSNVIERVERLESKIERLTQQVETLVSAASSRPVSGHPTSQPLPPPPVISRTTTSKQVEPERPKTQPQRPVAASTSPGFTLPEHMRKSEYWLNKIGIALLLFGAVFLFKYSVDQGWLTPTARVLFGLALGIVLAFIGFRIYGRRKHFSQVLLGGAIGTFYITGYAAFQIFHLIPYIAAFAFYAAVTLFAFFISLKQNEFIFSLIAILGGLGTPFILYTGEGSIPGLMFYLCVLLAGSSAIYYFKGWWSFFWTSCIGGWTVIWIGMFGDKSLTYAPMLDKISLEAALFLALPFFWLVPLGREIAKEKMPDLMKSQESKPKSETPGLYQPNLPQINVNLLTAITPALSLFLSTAIWDWSDSIWGVVSLSLAVLFAGVGWVLNQKTNLKNFAYTHFVVGLAFLTFALFFFLEGDVLLVALTLEAAAIHLIKIRIDDKSLSPLAHILYGIVAFLFLGNITSAKEGMALLNVQALSDLIVPASAFVLFRFFTDINEKRVYLIGGFAALAGILFRELDGNIEFLILSLESAAFLYLVSRLKDPSLLIVSHFFSVFIGAWLLIRLFEQQTGQPVFNFSALTNLIVIAGAAAATHLLTDAKEKTLYLLLAHVALLLWFLRELSPLTNGQGLVSVAWGVYIVALFVIGLRKDLKVVTRTAMVTLFILIGKLFLIDLANIATLWRVLLFMGFGSALLFLSYYFQSLWKARKE